MDWIGDGYNCTSYDQIYINRIMLGLGISSDIASLFGASFIIITFFIYKDLQTRARQFLLMISISDLFNSGAYLFGQSWSMFNLNYSSCYVGKPQYEIWSCVTQATFNNFFSLSCYSFTILLSFHVLFLLRGNNIFKGKVVFIFTVVVGWLVPLLITSVGFWPGWFGPGISVTVGTCFIRNFGDNSTAIRKDTLIELFVGKIWDVVTFVIISFVYSLAVCLLCRRSKQMNRKSLVSEQDFKLVFIPVAFLVFRIWGELHLIFMYRKYVDIFLYLQAIFEPGQGWANFLVYILLTKTIRNKFKFCKRKSSKNTTFNVTGSYSSFEKPMKDFSGNSESSYHLYKD